MLPETWEPRAFSEAKRRAIERLSDVTASHAPLAWLSDYADRMRSMFGEDFWPYGIEPNRPTLEALVTYMHDQAMIAKPMPLDELFVPTYGHVSPAY